MRFLFYGLLINLLGYSLLVEAFESSRTSAVYDASQDELSCQVSRLPEQVSLDDVIERVLCHDPLTRRSWANAKAQAAQLGVNQASFLPRLDGRLSSHRSERSTEGNQQQNSALLELSWVLFDFGKRNAALRNARHLLVAANAEQDATLQNAFAQAAQAFYDALAAQQSLHTSESIVELATQNLAAADARHKAGAAALSEPLQAKIALSQAQLRQIRNRETLHSLIGIIALRMGLPPQTHLKLKGDLTRLPDTQFVKALDQLLVKAQQEHPALHAARARLDASLATIEQSQAADMPSLALVGNVSQQLDNQKQRGDSNAHNQDRSVSLQLTVPLYDGFSRRYQIRNAQARAEADRADLANVEQNVALDLWTHYQAMSTEAQSLYRTDALVKQSRQALEVLQGRYHAGVGSMLEVLNALTAYASANDQHIQALSHWQTSRLKLAASLGQLSFAKL